ncbi:hypothetical protein EDC01DRAFT_628132 [Geopyxis carbonaria]|nr:hypothetical protein EDC01DRAFT_628132 [Geopyxis carbonaria]
MTFYHQQEGQDDPFNCYRSFPQYNFDVSPSNFATPRVRDISPSDFATPSVRDVSPSDFATPSVRDVSPSDFATPRVRDVSPRDFAAPRVRDLSPRDFAAPRVMPINFDVSPSSPEGIMLPEPAAIVEAGKIRFLLNNYPVEGPYRATEASAAATTPIITVTGDESDLIATPSKHRSRSYMSNDHKLMLMKLCVDHQDKNVYGSKKQFWLDISAMLEEETGLKLRDPQSTVSGLVATREAVVKKQRKESGTVQEETELTQILDMWIARDLEMKDMAKALKSPSAAQKEAEEAEIQRQNLLLPRGLKRKSNRPELLEDFEDEPLPDTPSKKPSPRKNKVADPAKQEVILLAMDRIGESMEAAARTLAESKNGPNDFIEAKFSRLEQEIKKQAEEHSIAREENSAMLAQIMSILLKKQNDIAI